jgi:hypothetical protein
MENIEVPRNARVIAWQSRTLGVRGKDTTKPFNLAYRKYRTATP